MFCLASKCARHNIYRNAYDCNRNSLQLIKLARIPVILSKDMADKSPCASTAGSGGGASKNQIMYKPYIKPAHMDHDYKNMRLKRPMSPHLTVYGPTLPAMTSISQRISGAIAAFYALMLSGGALFLSNGIDSYVSAIQSLDMSRFTILILKLIMGMPFAFHYLNGIRFVAFNSGRWLMRKDVYATGLKAVGGAAIIAVIFALL